MLSALLALSCGRVGVELTPLPSQSDAGPSACDAASAGTCESDGDEDGVPDDADNCPAVANPTQTDTDSDLAGDACDDDDDGDGIPDGEDVCSLLAGSDQTDLDADGIGDACDDDDDGDDVPLSLKPL